MYYLRLNKSRRVSHCRVLYSLYSLFLPNPSEDHKPARILIIYPRTVNCCSFHRLFLLPFSLVPSFLLVQLLLERQKAQFLLGGGRSGMRLAIIHV